MKNVLLLLFAFVWFLSVTTIAKPIRSTIIVQYNQLVLPGEGASTQKRTGTPWWGMRKGYGPLTLLDAAVVVGKQSDRLCTGPIKSSVLEDYWENCKVQLIYSIICIKWNTQTMGEREGERRRWVDENADSVGGLYYLYACYYYV